MMLSRRIVPGLLLVMAVARPVTAHSLEELEQEFVQNEKYFQAVDSEAPRFTLQDSDGRVVSLADFKGKIVVLNFLFTNCPDFCPLHAEKIAEVQEMVNITPMKEQVEFISITTDPKRDTGPVLKEFGKNHGLQPVNWAFLTTAPDQPEGLTRELAQSYGVEFMLAENGDQMHGVVTSVIDRDGRLVGRFHSLEFQSLNLVKFVNALINHHDPLGRDEPSLWDRLRSWF